MEISKVLTGSELTFTVSGRLDTTTSPELDEVVKNSLSGVDTLVFDFSDLEYISSAGLRVLLSAQKVMSTQGKMIVRNINDTIKEVFEITGFDSILTVE